MTNDTSAKIEAILDAVQSRFVGNRLLLKKVLAAALANGHVLFEDYPGLGKTLLMKVFARATGLHGSRVQFTPDILPADILGTKIWDSKKNDFRLEKGPIFTNVLLADEINRAPPKTQSALLESMEERQVTIEGETFTLPPPFFVLATQNPLEQEGTYPLPEAQMDRFLLRLSTGYPKDLASEVQILSRRVDWKKDDPTEDVRPVVGAADFAALQQEVENSIYVDPTVQQYIGAIVRTLRTRPQLDVGPSPRGSLALMRVARAMALIDGRTHVLPDDVQVIAVDCLAHRCIVDMEQALDGVTAQQVVTQVVKKIKPPTHKVSA